MALEAEIPGRPRLVLDHLLLDVNGTLTRHGELLEGVADRLGRIRTLLEPRLLSADTFGALAAVTAALDLRAEHAPDGDAKVAALALLGRERCAAIGNGANDAGMLAQAALGIAVIGPEGAAAAALSAADVVCCSILDALDLLLEPRALVATLRH